MAEAQRIPNAVTWIIGIIGAVATALTVGFFANLQSTTTNTAMAVVRIEAQLAAEQAAEANWRRLMSDQVNTISQQLTAIERRVTENDKRILKLER